MKKFCCVTVFLLAYLFALPPCGAWSERWSHFATDEDGVAHFYNSGSVKWIAEDIVQVWDKWELSGVDSGEFRRDVGRDAVSVKSLVQIHCRDRQHRSLKIVYLGSSGEEILTHDEPSAGWESVSPGSVVASLLQVLCIYGKLAI